MRFNIVETRGLTKRCGNGVLAVDRLDLQVRHGEVYGFLGHSGARKTAVGELRHQPGTVPPAQGGHRTVPASIGSFDPARWHQPAPTLAAT